MSDQITMEDEVSDVVRMLAERMDTNPEDFMDSPREMVSPTTTLRNPPQRFASVYDAVKRSITDQKDSLKVAKLNGLWFLNDAEIAVLQEAAIKMARRAFEAGTLEVLYNKSESIPAATIFGTTGAAVNSVLGQQAMNNALNTGLGMVQIKAEGQSVLIDAQAAYKQGLLQAQQAEMMRNMYANAQFTKI